ncbi:MAG: argininosuccinate lyase [Planctomycetota bacterium]|nr:MAG: argininosuccinate lyase [Planctomycetota bacterium]
MDDKSKKKPLWGGRFAEGMDPLMVRFGASLPFDRQLYQEDIEVNIAWAHALRGIGIISEDELKDIENGLDRVRDEIESGSFDWDIKFEDVHTAIEARLTEFIGDAARKLHTGRSRNDQVATDFRLFVMKAIDGLSMEIRELQSAIIETARENMDIIMPGYTHLQRAQPVRFSHYIMALFWMLERDLGRLIGCRKRADSMPLGSGALAGSAFPVDREALADELGFSAVSDNSIDAVSDRDFATETAAALSILIAHLSRYAEDFIIWSSAEFGFIELPDAFSTGSSMMPQKKNPDSLELVRGRTGRVFGDLIALLTFQKGLPLTYQKDMQEDKEPLFDAIGALSDCLEIFAGVLDGLKLNPDRMAEMGDEIFATDLADYLTRKGMPFREAHHVVGELVLHAEISGGKLSGLSLETYRKHSGLFEEDLFSLFDAAHSADLRAITGGTAKEAVEKQITAAEELL